MKIPEITSIDVNMLKEVRYPKGDISLVLENSDECMSNDTPHARRNMKRAMTECSV